MINSIDFNAYRPCVGVMLLNSKKQVFIGQRLNAYGHEAWQMPQGGIEVGETPHAAALRELKEEIGTNNVQILVQSVSWYFYDLPEYLQGKLWGGNYCGQRQKWMLAKFKGRDSEINIHTEVPEFKAWRWAFLHELPDLVVPFKRQTYLDVVAEFKPKIDLL